MITIIVHYNFHSVVASTALQRRLLLCNVSWKKGKEAFKNKHFIPV